MSSIFCRFRICDHLTLHVHDGEEEVRVDPYAADVWVLGLIFLEILMGHYALLPDGREPTWEALICTICFGKLPAIPDSAA
ncbi:hypothetical protein QYE76_062907 [Lolium multiflorum]|uniref:Protein kinase domain-containing protein n=1 Tax=Lolium multiflorum TaxID=4521 RepID=A0AAD8S6F9_LOLMU|nr:hypothetical protein QYE76_062907 [Lolium multiflorum]